VVASVWQLAVCRMLAGVGIGGEWSMGGTFVAEEWPEDRRKAGAGYMHTGYYFGFFLAALANYFIGARYGWRVMFAVGGVPALLVGFIRQSVHESARWTNKVERKRPSMIASFGALFSATYARRTIINALLLLVSVVGLWAGSVYVPTSMTQLARAAGYTAPQAAQMASYGTMVLSAGTILGCLAVAPLAERLGRRLTLGIYFVMMFLSISIGFGYVFYLGSISLFMIVLFFLGIGGANFAMYTLWLPEQYSTECRASAFAFATSVGRFAGAGITFLVGAAVSYYGTLGTPVAFTSIAFLVGLLFLPMGEETTGRPLPA
jgi:MFS family permease